MLFLHRYQGLEFFLLLFVFLKHRDINMLMFMESKFTVFMALLLSLTSRKENLSMINFNCSYNFQ